MPAMTGLERTRAAIRGQPVDRIPVFPILLAPACQLTGVPQRKYNLDPAVMADTLLRAREMCGFDGIYVSRDNWVYHEALGGALSFPEDDESFSTSPLLESLVGWRSLSVPDPEQALGMKTLLAAARKVVEAEGDRYYIQANIDTGPFSLAAVLRGTQTFLLDVAAADQRDLRALLEFCTDVVIAYGKAMIATGVHGIQFGDATASLVSPSDFQKFVLPYERRALAALQGDCDLWIHICGKTDHVLPMMRDLPFQGFEVDSRVQMRQARHLLGDRIALKGNLDTTFLLQRSAQEVLRECRRILDSGPFSSGVILSPGCAVPRMTPLANLRAMMQAASSPALGTAEEHGHGKG